ncbi:Hypothetical predicted protein [Mytilus galloprovincialis]|uniref:Cadherin domain-containing protein n=1 Tax=Mytilus galloprovincialis TaxID=29158 RepID=A0A8B6G303_MYTGA|nr:Hypothetical predicted protein [Mytilus galloprovincialis]
MRQVYRLLLFILGNLECSSSQSIQQPRWNNDISDLHEIPENLPLDSKLATISATGLNGVDVILITYGTETERRVSFNYTKGINAVGTVYLKEEMDREEMSTWELYFKAYDSKIGPDQVREEKLTIYITDVNDNAPKFTAPFYQEEVPENALKGYIVTAITASDPDNGNGGRFSLRLESAHLYQAAFNISQKVVDGKTVGTVTLKRELDYEILSFYQYLIIATDKDPDIPLSSNVTLVIKVKDIQDSPPYFQGLPYVTEIDENVHIDHVSISNLSRIYPSINI